MAHAKMRINGWLTTADAIQDDAMYWEKAEGRGLV